MVHCVSSWVIMLPFGRYFELFDVVSDLDSAERLRLLQTGNECATTEELGNDLN